MRWSILIEPMGADRAGAAGFKPDLQGAAIAQPLGVLSGDNITWNNTTDAAHWPWPTDSENGPMFSEADARAKGVYLSDDVAAGDPSSPVYNASPVDPPPPPPAGFAPGFTRAPPGKKTIFYCCKNHPNEPSEKGSIVIG
jgi:hypothetical protein